MLCHKGMHAVPALAVVLDKGVCLEQDKVDEVGRHAFALVA